MSIDVWVVYSGWDLPMGYSEHRDAAEAYARDLEAQNLGPATIKRGPIPEQFRIEMEIAEGRGPTP